MWGIYMALYTMATETRPALKGFGELRYGTTSSRYNSYLKNNQLDLTGTPSTEIVTGYLTWSPCPPLFEQCVESLMPHTSVLRCALRFIVLIREDEKV